MRAGGAGPLPPPSLLRGSRGAARCCPQQPPALFVVTGVRAQLTAEGTCALACKSCVCILWPLLQVCLVAFSNPPSRTGRRLAGLHLVCA